MFLLDTNIISESKKAKPHLGFLEWAQKNSMDDCFLSVLTVGEIMRGILNIEKRGQSGDRLRRWLTTIEEIYAPRILPVTRAVCIQWAELVQQNPNHDVDMLIAATAITHRLTLVTRNSDDFARIPNLTVLNPFAV